MRKDSREEAKFFYECVEWRCKKLGTMVATRTRTLRIISMFEAKLSGECEEFTTMGHRLLESYILRAQIRMA